MRYSIPFIRTVLHAATGQRNKALRYALLVAAVAPIDGCGFHFRGSNLDPNLQVSKAYVASQGAASLADELSRQLQYNGVALSEKPAQSQIVITVMNERNDERILSVDPRTGKAREYELNYHVNFRISKPGGEVVFADQSIDLSRDFTFDEAAALSKFEEAKVVRDEMKRDAVDSILRRVERVQPQR